MKEQDFKTGEILRFRKRIWTLLTETDRKIYCLLFQ